MPHDPTDPRNYDPPYFPEPNQPRQGSPAHPEDNMPVLKVKRYGRGFAHWADVAHYVYPLTGRAMCGQRGDVWGLPEQMPTEFRRPKTCAGCERAYNARRRKAHASV